MRARLASQRGTAIVTAIALLSAMAALGLASYTVADTQQVESTRERQREGSFNHAEGVLNTQAFILSRGWPGNAGAAYPNCQVGATATRCPQSSQLAATFQTADYASGLDWRSSVRDDVSGSAYDATVRNAPSWDANDNNRIWIRSQATVRGRVRTMVALVRVEEANELLPRRTVIAGYFKTGNNGNKVVVETNSTASSPHPVTVRCNPNSGSSCADWREPDQINGEVAGPEFVGQPALADETVERLKERAIADGTYYAGCPSDLAGKVVYVEQCDLSPSSNDTFNSASNPGMLIVNRGTFHPSGDFSYYGIVYMRNAQSSTGLVVDTQGCSQIFGGIWVDGPGGVDVGECKGNLQYLDQSFGTVASYGAAGLVQNSFREVRRDEY